jgi:hypothetical protein
MSTYGEKLNPFRALRKPLGVKGNRTSIVNNNNPSTINEKETLTVRFPNLGEDDVIVPYTARLAFTIELDSTDKNRTVVKNLGRSIVKKISVKLDGNEIACIDDADIFYLYKDLWLPVKKRDNLEYQGIQNVNTAALRIKAENAVKTTQPDASIAHAFGNRFYIPLDIEIINEHSPYYQSGLTDRLSFELTFNDYGRVIISTAPSSYKISSICLEYDIVTHPELARLIRQQYEQQLIFMYSRILRQRKMVCNRSDAVWNINLNTPAKSMTGILLLFEHGSEDFQRNSESFYNPKIKKVSVTVEGKPNQLYASGLLPYHHYEEIYKFFGNDTSYCTHSNYFKSYYGLWLDFRTSDDNTVHGSGRRIENASEGITLQIEKEVEAAGSMNCYIYLVMDAQLNISSGRFISSIY